jgi:predicted dehydrogenase/threonine dehydrogenase-like Zn-dependent dehydrogenase
LKQVLIRSGSPTVLEVPPPQLTDNTILVEVRYCLISTGTEMAGLASSAKSLVRQAVEDPGKVLRGLRMLKEIGFRRTKAIVDSEVEAAFAVGYSCSGIVLACGKNITNFSVGDRVACAGSGIANHAEIVAVPQNLAVRVPEGCDLESAASATIGAIAMQGVRRADPRLGEVIAVIGLGLIGQLTLQLLKAAGCRTLGMDIDAERVTLARKLGMSAGLHPDDGDVVRAVLDLTQGHGADAVIVTASSQAPGILQQAMQMVRRKGRVVVVGAVPLQVERSPFYEKEAELLISCSYGPGRYDAEYEQRGLDYPFAYVRWTENRNMTEYLRLVAESQVNVRALVGSVWPLTQAPEAYAELREKKSIATLLSNPEGQTDRKLETRVALSPKPKKGSKEIRVGIIGPGGFAKAVHLPNLKTLSELFSIRAVAAKTGTNALNVANQYGAAYASTAPDEIFKDPDIDLVVISSRHDLHATLAIQAARHGKAVLLEKPAALNESELTDLLDAFTASGTLLMVGYNRRFSPFVRETKAALDGRKGPILATYRMNAGHVPPTSWVQGPEGGGRIIGECCHIFDLMNYMTGTFPEEVAVLPLRPSAAHILPTDNFAASVRYRDGSLWTLVYTSLGSSEVPKEYMEIHFDGKTILLEDYRKLSFHGTARPPVKTVQQEKGHLEELQALAAYLLRGGPLPMTLEEIESATRTSFLIDRHVRAVAASANGSQGLRP